MSAWAPFEPFPSEALMLAFICVWEVILDSEKWSNQAETGIYRYQRSEGREAQEGWYSVFKGLGRRPGFAVLCPPHIPSLSYPESLSAELLDSGSPPLWWPAFVLQRVPSPALIPELLALPWHQVVSPPLPSLALRWSKLTIQSDKLFHVSCGFPRPKSFQTIDVRLHEENQPPSLKTNWELEQQQEIVLFMPQVQTLCHL